MRVKLAWKLGFSYLALVLLALVATDFYAGRALREAYLGATLKQLDSLSRLITSRPPPLESSSALAAWTVWAARSGAPAVVRLALPVAYVNESLAAVRRRLWITSLIILAAGAAVSFLFSRRFAARVRRLKDFSARVSQGDFRGLEVAGPRDELDELSLAFNQTAAQLGQTIRSLAGERNRTAAIVASMAEGLAVLHPGQRLLFSNPAFARLIGGERSRLEGCALVEVVRQRETEGRLKRPTGLDHVQIRKILPHRYPMLMVDRVV